MTNLKAFRESQGVTQEELGELVGITSDYVSQIERGKVPGMKTASKLADIFGTTIDALFFAQPANETFEKDKSA